MTGIMDFINGFFHILQTILSWMLDGLMYVLKTALYFAWDGLLTAITGLFTALNVSNVLVSAASTWSAMPSQLLYLVNQIGIPQGLTILGYAYLIRMTLNLIPAAFTRI
jgi:F0F1-type ATP synthase membrane subunit c/vacuolar-type H+-ATPase subunit K